MAHSKEPPPALTKNRLRTIIVISLALSVTLPLVHHANATAPSYGYSRKWGSFGGPSGPNGVAIDPFGNVYVADIQNYAVGKMNSAGAFQTIWGSKGNGQGQFNNPLGIGTDSAGNVFVSDSVNNNVQKFSGTGSFLSSWNSNGNGTASGMLFAPLGLAVNASGYVYVVDSGHQRVGIFRNDGGFVKYFRLAAGANFTQPFGIAIDPQGFVYVDDANLSFDDSYSGNITKFTKNGVRVSSWGGINSGGTIFQPQGLAVDASSNIYVTDVLAERVQKFNTGTQNLLLTWGTMGTTPGKFTNPSGIAVDGLGNVFVGDSSNFNVQKFNGATGAYVTSLSYQRMGLLSTPYGVAVDSLGNTYVADRDNNRIQKFNSFTGSLVTSWGLPGNLTGQFNGPSGIAIDHSGNLYVTDSGNSRIQQFSLNGNFIKTWNLNGSPNGLAFPTGIAADSSNHVYVADSTNDRVEKFDAMTGGLILQWGSSGQANGNFAGPQGIAVDPSGSVYVTDTGNNRVQKFTGNGVFVASWGSTGSGNNQFNSPGGIALDSAGNIYVADTYNSRVEVFAGNQTFLATFGTVGSGNGQMINPWGVTIDSSDSIYVTDSNLANPGTVNNRVEVFAPVHDPAATKLILSRNTAYTGITFSQPVQVNVTVSNFGLSLDTFWVKALANASIIGQQNVTVTPGQSTLVSFSWFPSVASRTTFNVTAQVQTISGDPNLSNNKVLGGLFYVRLRGDVSGDCRVDISDLVITASYVGSTPSSTRWNPNADLNNDGVVDITDIVLVALVFGSAC